MRAAAVALVVVLAGCVSPETTEDAPALDASVDAASTNATAPAATAPSDMAGGHAPHIHDYWGEKERVTLFDGDVEVQALSEATFFNVFMRGDPAAGGAFWTLPEGATVYEGTGLIEMTLAWTDPTITGLGVAWKTPNEAVTRNRFREVQAVASGQPFAIEVAPEMTDMPHDAVTRWEFYLAAHGQPAVAQGVVHLTFDVVRMRDVMLFPGHPDMYEDVDSYLLEDADFAYKRPNLATFFVDNLQGTDTTPIVPDVPVPMETRVLLVEITVVAVSGLPGSTTERIDLLWRAADGKRYATEALEHEGDRWLFGIPVDDHEVDSPYATESAWRIAPFARTATAGLPCDFCADVEVSGHAVVTAYAVDPTGKVPRERDEV